VPFRGASERPERSVQGQFSSDHIRNRQRSGHFWGFHPEQIDNPSDSAITAILKYEIDCGLPLTYERWPS
jgi:hypothetical protein